MVTKKIETNFLKTDEYLLQDMYSCKQLQTQQLVLTVIDVTPLSQSEQNPSHLNTC